VQVEQLLRLHGFHRAIAGLKLDLLIADEHPFSAANARISTVRMIVFACLIHHALL
jgi:hypothetical protein